MHPGMALKLHEFLRAPNKNGDVGIELEYEGLNLPIQVTGWEVKHDGTLRGQDGMPVIGDDRADMPREYVTQRPVLVSSVAAKLRTLIQALTTAPSEVRLTPRAGTHIHVNMGNQTLRTFLGFVLLYLTVEPVFLRVYGGAERNGNSFCMPGYETGAWPNVINRVVQYLLRPYDYTWPTTGKYSALNIDPLLPLGSVEVRCFPNSINPVEIMQWVQSLMSIRQIAQSASDDFSTILNWIHTSPNEYLDAVFPDVNLARACAPVTPFDLLQYGQEEAYEVWRSMLPLFRPAAAKARAPRHKPHQFNEDDIQEAPGIEPLQPVPRPPDWGQIEPLQPEAAVNVVRRQG